ncbi:mitochondrial fission ELM1 family protein [Desulfotalea psychrophila]|uniref:Uncharacterized protein n=1 Tax=Desulfotalea psychrophila (strain LSv54 / DSM 12343) TaxID=177439 RepID=Q6AL21_DESPS|nr:mitochondrial fission ELM1 family protein [Desulfotalea psychrophila]CAG36954.1 unknown protein [Desulfotalea psychrophila LSv54]
MSSTRAKIRVTIFLDGRPGHEKQTMGIVNALRERVEVDCTAVDVRGRGWWTGCKDVLTLLFARGSSANDSSCTDLYLGTGRRTHIPLLLAQRAGGGSSVCCMMPASWLRRYFNFCFVPSHDRPAPGPQIVRTCGPANCSVDEKRHEQKRGLILVGGVDLKSHFWQSKMLCLQIEELIGQDERQWVISSSPRTPPETVDDLRGLAAKFSQVEFFHYKDTPAGWVEEQYNCSSVVWVTVDSISMVFEALTAGCQVGLLPVEWKKKGSKYQKSEQFLLDENYVISFADWQAGHSWQEGITVLNEAKRCAGLIMEKLCQKN